MSDRYSRQILLSEVGEKGQAKLSKSHVAVVGCGGLGAIAASYLAGAGIGSLTLIDGDQPDISNVHRQVLYTGEEGEAKSLVLNKKLRTLNPEIKIHTSTNYLTKENIDEHLTGVDLIMECTDDIMCKYLVNDFAVIEQIPLVYGAIYKYEGYVSTFINQEETDLHLRDLFPYPDETIPTCSEVGVLNTIAGLIGLLQANEVLKVILDIGEPLVGKLLTYDCLTNRQLVLKMNKTWTEDMEELFEKTSYLPLDCSIVQELSIKDLISNRDQFSLISVLSQEEHHPIDAQTVHLPNVKWEHVDDLSANLPIVLYCKTGRVSKKLAAKLMDEKAGFQVYSLKDGLKGYRKFIS